MTKILKKAKNTTQDIGDKIAKQATFEKNEFIKSAKTQVGGDGGEPSIVDQMILEGDGVDKPSVQEQKDIEIRTRKRIKELEEELSKIRKDRREKYEVWKTQQEKEMKATDLPEEEKVLVEPVSRPKRGVLANIKKRQGTREMGKTRSG